MEIRRNMVPPQVQNKGKVTNEQIKDEPKEIQAGDTTVKPADVFYTQGNNNNNGNNGTNNNGRSKLEDIDKEFDIEEVSIREALDRAKAELEEEKRMEEMLKESFPH